MRAFFTFSAFIGACLLAAAALFYPVWLGIGALNDVEPHKILPRLAKILAAVALFFLLRRMHLWNRKSLGYDLPRRDFVASVARGWMAGAAIMLVPFAALVLLGVREWNADGLTSSLLAGIAAKALVAGLAVGFIEETFFRGAIFGGIRREASLWPAVMLSSLIYAALHFIRTQPFDPGAPVGWSSGFPLLASAFGQFGESAIADSFAALMAAGIFLALLRTWTGNIALAIGVHAGWVAVIKVGKKVTDPAPDAAYGFLAGSYDGVIGWLAAAWLLVLVVLVRPRAAAGERSRTGNGPLRG